MTRSDMDVPALRARMRTIRLSRFACHHGRVGQRGPKIMLVMGLGMPGISWHPLITRLAPHAQLLWYDNPGVGGSTARAGRATMEDYAHDAEELMVSAGWDSAHVVGISMGGMVAQHLALLAPSRVRSLSLLATSPGPFYRFLPPRRGIEHFLRANLTQGEDRIQALLRLLYPPDRVPGTLQEVDPSLLETLANPSPRATRVQQIKAVFGHHALPRLSSVAPIPSLVVRPGQDILVPPRASDALAAALPGATLLRLDQAGHAVIAQEAMALTDAILATTARAKPR